MMYALHYGRSWGPLPPTDAFRFVTFACGHVFGCWIDPEEVERGRPVPKVIGAFLALGQHPAGRCHACLDGAFQDDGTPKAMVSKHADGSWWFLLLPAEPLE